MSRGNIAVIRPHANPPSDVAKIVDDAEPEHTLYDSILPRPLPAAAE